MAYGQIKHVALQGALALFACTLAFGADAAPQSMEGVIKSVSVKARTLSVQVKGKELKLINLNDGTKLNNAASIKELIAGDRISFAVGDDSVATVITREVVSLPKGVTAVTTADLEKLVELGPAKGNYLLMDARPASKFKEGFIRTAVSVPYAELAANPAKFLPKDKKKTLIFYCDGATCDLSARAAMVAVKKGYKNVRLYPEGLPGWNKGDYCTATSLDYIQHGNVVLIDLRSPDKVAKGHIPRAVNIPAKEFKDAEARFPEYKGASIVFYGDSLPEIREAISNAKDWGYNHASAFTGGIEEWTGNGLKLVTGPAATTITYEHKLSANEVGYAEFKKIIGSGSVTLVDVRTKDEFAKGHFPEAVNIPLEEISKRLTELPKAKPVLLHCSSGARAEMAFDILKDKGYDIRYVRATVEFGKDGKAKITE